RDRLVVVGDLVDDDRLHADGDALRRHTLEIELGFVDVERQAPYLLQTPHDERALADDDLEAKAGGVAGGAVVGAQAGDDQCFVRFGDAVEEYRSLLASRSGG